MMKFTPKPHLNKAIDLVFNSEYGLNNFDRTQLIMACGTGANVWNVKIIKYTFSGVIASGYGYGLCKLNDYCDPSLNRIVMVTIIALSWLMLDYISAHRNFKQMWISQRVLKTYRWLFSA